ncbi:MAG TPA: hypothetical protein VFK03_04080, partial [Candidatus Saccharimonadales bacterium]|nr:hypothetical protein [Candidatus Saccharimonadales bacterium]
MKQRIINKYTALGLAALIALVTTFFFTQDKPQVVEADETIERQSQFSFDGAPDWRLGPTNQTSIALFHDRDGCFVSA